MPVFAYVALKAGKDTVNGIIEAETLREARESLRRLDLVPTRIQEQGTSNNKIQEKTKNKPAKKKPLIEKKSDNKRPLQRLSLQDKIDFATTLHILSKTGISLIEALFFIEVNANNSRIQNLSAKLRKNILTGSNLSEALAKYPHIFGQIYIGLIKAGEESGELDITLERMIYLLNKQDRLKSKIVSTLMYPCFIIALAVIVTTIMITFVFPAFKGMYDSMGQKLPLITQIFMSTGLFLKHYWFMIPLMFFSIGYFLYFIFTWSSSRKIIDKFVCKVPKFGDFVKYAALSNFISILKVSFDAGIPIVDAIMLANISVSNYEINAALKDTASRIQNGQSLSSALKSTGVIPGLIMCMIATGEESGQLADTLEQAGIYIDTQVERLVEMLNKLFEPLLLLVIGVIVLTLALALYLPLFKTYSNMV